MEVNINHWQLPTENGVRDTVVTQQLQGLPTLASAWVVIDCKSVHLPSILSRCDVIWMGKLRMPYLYHQSDRITSNYVRNCHMDGSKLDGSPL